MNTLLCFMAGISNRYISYAFDLVRRLNTTDALSLYHTLPWGCTVVKRGKKQQTTRSEKPFSSLFPAEGLPCHSTKK